MLARHVARAAFLGVSLGTAAPALAQDSASCVCRPRADRIPSEFERRSSGTLAFIQTRPVGALEQNIGFGYGVNGTYLLRLDRTGIFSLRADLGIAGYGEESKRVPLSSTIGGRIQVRVSTTNYVVPMSIGPQITFPTGRVRPYVNAGLGGQVFYTESHVDGVDDNHDFASTTNHSDATSSWVAGGGVYIPLSERRVKVLLDVGVQYINGGEASYLRPGSIVDMPDNQIRITPMRSDTHLMLMRIGVKVGL